MNQFLCHRIGQYGYVKLDKNKTQSTISGTIQPRTLPFGSFVQQLMFSFNYFFTVYPNIEVEQNLEFGFRDEADPEALIPLAVITIKNVSSNGWQLITITLPPDLASFKKAVGIDRSMSIES